VLGVILNGEKNIENKKAIEFYGKIKVIFEFPKLEDDLVHSIHLMKLEDVFLDRMLYVS